MKTTLSAPPGGWLGHLPALQRDPLVFLAECARDYGPVAPLRFPAMSALLLLDADDIERVLVTDHQNFVKPIWLRTAAVRRLLGDGLVTTDGDDWRRQRRQCQPAFLPHQIPAYGDTFAALTGRMLSQWRRGQTRDVQSDMARLTLEIVARTMLGSDIAAQAGEIGEAMDTVMACFGAKHRLFGLLPLPPSRREARAIGRLDALVDALIAEYRAGGAHQSDAPLLGSLLSDPDQDPAYVREQVKTFLAAGHESSALALTWAFLLLARHPGADARLARELDSVLGGRAPTQRDLPDLPYTLAVVKETLRLYPPLWMVGRTAVKDGVIGGFPAPRGALILTSPWAVQRSAQYFADPDAFIPERWLDGSQARLPKYAYFPFGGGPRVCIGQNFAVMETTLLLATIAARFRLEGSPDQDISPWATMTLRPPPGILMRLAERGAPRSVS
ncbi:cytochrome P450 [Capsulimonas corticalis]|uniref:Cytochrome P450 n=1 Tax=Capsulimonas corticalis TaxID=2219043 RepID=A0A402CZC3_9BACT|nr:cytochrome P450 [Capsulimonas corticalis]BDI29468.1 cytochrome P450 [Capsulimonas corticalis]